MQTAALRPMRRKASSMRRPRSKRPRLCFANDCWRTVTRHQGHRRFAFVHDRNDSVVVALDNYLRAGTIASAAGGSCATFLLASVGQPRYGHCMCSSRVASHHRRQRLSQSRDDQLATSMPGRSLVRGSQRVGSIVRRHGPFRGCGVGGGRGRCRQNGTSFEHGGRAWMRDCDGCHLMARGGGESHDWKWEMVIGWRWRHCRVWSNW